MKQRFRSVVRDLFRLIYPFTKSKNWFNPYDV